MPALNFMKQFADDVRDGIKTTTIRKEYKRPIKCGDTLHLYTGMRTKSCSKLGVAECIGVRDIVINDQGLFSGKTDLVQFDTLSQLSIAIDDGFDDFESMAEFFDRLYGLPFQGVLIQWQLLKKQQR